MVNRVPFVLALATACLVQAHVLTAQPLTGSLIGTVKDAQGGVLPGAVVRLSSPALIGGTQTLTTNEKGQLRFPALPSRRVLLDVEVNGFKAYHEEGIRIGIGATIDRIARPQPEGRRGIGGGGRIGFAARGARQRFRNPLWSRGSQARSRRGASACLISSGPRLVFPPRRQGACRPTAFPRSVPGPTRTRSRSTARTSPVRAAARRDPSRASTSSRKCKCSLWEHRPSSATCRVLSSTWSPGRGATDSCMTRRTTDRAPALTSQPVKLVYPGPDKTTSGYERVKYHDLTTNLGGPIVHDRAVVLYGISAPARLRQSAGQRPRPSPRTYEQDKIFGKLTWRLAPRLQLLQSLSPGILGQSRTSHFTKPFEATQRRHAIGSGRDVRTADAHAVTQHRVGCARRPIQLYPRRRSEHWRRDDTWPVR